jgi:hypothetical protein
MIIAFFIPRLEYEGSVFSWGRGQLIRRVSAKEEKPSGCIGFREGIIKNLP